jgi:hypothetical protein
MSKWPLPVPGSTYGTALVLPEVGDDATIKHLKRPALLFKKIAVFHLSGLTALLGKLSSDADLQLKTDLEWLVHEGIVVPFETGFFEDFYQHAADRPNFFVPDHVSDAMDYASKMSFSAQFQWLPYLKLTKWIDADSVLVCNQSLQLLQPQSKSGRSADHTSVLNIVVHAFPEPDEDTPWERIVEFRSDPDAAGQVLALKRWMSKIAQQNISAAEVSEEIEWLIGEYQAHMRLHRMKVTMGALETIVTAAGETFENVVKLKFGALAKSVFSVQHRRIQLLEAERQAPGRELAYIVRARELFARTDPR